MARPSATLRLFAAIYPPPETAAALLKAMTPLSMPPHRPTLCEQVHMTLQFIGDTPVKDLEATIESLQRATAGLHGFELTPQRLLTLPERGPARLVAAQTDAPATLVELQRRLVTRLARNVRDRNTGRFRPHLTLGRFKSPTQGLKIDQALDLPAFAVRRISLMRSILAPDHARHDEVTACELLPIK